MTYRLLRGRQAAICHKSSGGNCKKDDSNWSVVHPNFTYASPYITKVLEMFERDLHKLDMPPKLQLSFLVILYLQLLSRFSSEDSVYNLNTESMSPSSSAETQGSSEGLKAEEIKHVNSNVI